MYFTVHSPWGLVLMCASPCLYITRHGPSRSSQICRLYRRVYEEEEATSDAPPAAQSTVPILNRWVGGALLTEPLHTGWRVAGGPRVGEPWGSGGLAGGRSYPCDQN